MSSSEARGSLGTAGKNLQRKIFLRTSLLITFLVTLSGSLVALRAVHDQRLTEQERLKTIASVLAEETRPLLDHADHSTLRDLLAELAKSHDAIAYAVVVRDGKVLAASPPRGELRFEESWLPLHGPVLSEPSVVTVRQGTGTIVEDAAVPLDSQTIVRIGIVRPRIDARTTERIWAGLAVSAAALLLGLLFAWSIAVAITKEVIRAETALRESEQRYRLLFDQAPDSIMLLDFAQPAEAKVIAANAATARTYGYPPDQLLGLLAATLDAPLEAGQIAKRAEELKTGKVAKFETIHARQDGSTFPVEVSAQLFQAEGRPVVQAIARDISERRRAEAEKSRLEGELQQAQKMEAIGRLAGGVAHDMNNTLGAIMGTASVVKTRLVGGDPHHEHLDNILLACQRGQELTRDLLGFARKGKYIRKQTSLSELATETRNLLERTIPKGIRVELALDPALRAIEGDPGQLSHALMNLCVNALDAMGESGVLSLTTRNVHLTEASNTGPEEVPPGDYVELLVRDTGTGMDPETLARAFEPFFTTKPSGLGTGLGMSMVQGAIRSHGGFVRVKSELGKGTVVSWILPASEKPAEPVARRRVRSVMRGRGSVLLVDDEVLIRWSGKKMLEELGYTVVEAASGADAVKAYEYADGKIDVVILDLIMPGQDGTATFQSLRRIDGQVRVLIASGFTEERKVEELLKQGAAGFIEKPFDLHLLAERLAQVLADEVEESA